MSNATEDPIERMLRLLIKLKLQEMWEDKSQKEMIESLHGLGCSAAEIGDLLNMPMTSVSPVLSRIRKEPKKTKTKK